MIAEAKDKLVNGLDEIKAINPLAFDVDGIVSYADWVVVASATSGPHLKALVRKAEEVMLKEGIKPIGIEGINSASDWVLIDFGDIVVHLLTEEKRDFYNLEKIFVRAE
ncbi:ribosome silencing factor [Ignatzschineria sp. LJL83]